MTLPMGSFLAEACGLVKRHAIHRVCASEHWTKIITFPILDATIGSVERGWKSSIPAGSCHVNL